MEKENTITRIKDSAYQKGWEDNERKNCARIEILERHNKSLHETISKVEEIHRNLTQKLVAKAHTKGMVKGAASALFFVIIGAGITWLMMS